MKNKLVSWKISICNGIYNGHNKIIRVVDHLIIADEIDSKDKAEGFVYGYVEGKNELSKNPPLKYEDDPILGDYYTIFTVENIEDQDHEYYFFEEIQSKKNEHPASDDPLFSDLDLPRYVVLNLRRGGIKSSAELIQAYKNNPESIRKIHHIGNKKWHIIKNAIESR